MGEIYPIHAGVIWFILCGKTYLSGVVETFRPGGLHSASDSSGLTIARSLLVTGDFSLSSRWVGGGMWTQRPTQDSMWEVGFSKENTERKTIGLVFWLLYLLRREILNASLSPAMRRFI